MAHRAKRQALYFSIQTGREPTPRGRWERGLFAGFNCVPDHALENWESWISSVMFRTSVGLVPYNAGNPFVSVIPTDMIPTHSLATSLTWKGSKLTYLIGRLLVDRRLKGDFFRAYAYFRWLDDMIDETGIPQTRRMQIVARQSALIRSLFSDAAPVSDLCPEEEMLVRLVGHPHNHGDRLRSFTENMFAIIEFDAHRKDRQITTPELDWYSERLSQSVVDGLQYFIGNDHDYPESEHKYSAAHAAHITHLLRDTVQDIANGFINIPQDVLIQPSLNALADDALRAWVKDRVGLARRLFQEGRSYIQTIQVRRCRLASHLYCTQFERILDTIERDRYVLRSAYH